MFLFTGILSLMSVFFLIVSAKSGVRLSAFHDGDDAPSIKVKAMAETLLVEDDISDRLEAVTESGAVTLHAHRHHHRRRRLVPLITHPVTFIAKQLSYILRPSRVNLPIVTLVRFLLILLRMFPDGSPWERIELQVRSEIKTYLTRYHENDLLGILKHCRERLLDLCRRAKAVNVNGSSSSVITNLVDDLYNHYFNYVRGQRHLFHMSKFQDLFIYDATLFHISFAFLSHELIILKMLESQCAQLHPPSIDRKYQPSNYGEKLNELRREIKERILPESTIAAKRLFWNDLNFQCEKGNWQELSCVDKWSGEKTTYFWDLRLKIVKGSSYKKWNLHFDDADFGVNTDDDAPADPADVETCSGQAFFDFPNASIFNPGDFDNCSRVTWNNAGECRKIPAHRDKFVESGALCGVSPNRTFLKVAEDLWANFTAPTLFMIGESVATDVKNMSASGDACLEWKNVNEAAKKGWASLPSNLCANPDDWVRGPWCFTSETVRRPCFDITLPTDMFPDDCLSPSRKYGDSFEWCIKAKSKNYPYGGSWKKVTTEAKNEKSATIKRKFEFLCITPSLLIVMPLLLAT